MNKKRNNNYLLNWIETLQAQGKYVFTYEQACIQFNGVSHAAITLSLNRLSRKKKVVSVFKKNIVLDCDYLGKHQRLSIPLKLCLIKCSTLSSCHQVVAYG